MTISALPTVPTTASPTTFAADMDTFLAALPTFRTEVNALASAMTAVAAGGAVSLQYTFSTTTTDSDPGSGNLRLDNATQNASTVIRADLVGSDGSTLTSVLDLIDDSTSTNKGYLTLRNSTDATKWLVFAVASLASPSGYRNITVTCVASSAASPLTNGDAILLDFTPTGDKGETGATGAAGASPTVARSTRTSNTILGVADQGKLIDITSGTFTQTFTAAATLGSGWFCYVRNSGTGDVTLDPNGSETIDGITTFVMYPGEARLIQCDGSNLYSVVMAAFSRTFLTTGTFTTPPGYTNFGGLLWGGGGGGGRSNALAVAVGGGGGGACVPVNLTATSLGASTTITIGAGGTAVATPTVGDGGIGGTSSIGTLAYAYGGGGGGGNAADRVGGGGGGAYSAGATGGAGSGAGGKPTNWSATANALGFAGAAANVTNQYTADSEWGGAGGGINAAGTPREPGQSVYGGAGGAGVTSANATGAGNTSRFGGAGGAGSSAGAASAGSVPAGGGGGNQTGSTSGAGGAGKCIIWGIA